MTFGTVINNMTPYIVSISMILYGSLLLHHSNMIIKKKMTNNNEEFANCRASDNVLLAQGVAIIVTLMGVLALSATLYSKHPGIKQKLNYLGDVHTKYGGHPYAKYAKMLLVLGFGIYFLVDLENHKGCTSAGGIGGEPLLLAANIAIVSLIGLYLLYKLTLIIMNRKNS
tara:strand:+ start:58 stop:567 length:510 start_codon:yes stop_codon:yes gene_type:complete